MMDDMLPLRRCSADVSAYASAAGHMSEDIATVSSPRDFISAGHSTASSSDMLTPRDEQMLPGDARPVPWSLQRLSTAAKGSHVTERHRHDDDDLREYEEVEALCNSVHGIPAGSLFGDCTPHLVELTTVRQEEASPVHSPLFASSNSDDCDDELNIYGEIHEQTADATPAAPSQLRPVFLRRLDLERMDAATVTPRTAREWVDTMRSAYLSCRNLPREVVDALGLQFGELLAAARQAEKLGDPESLQELQAAVEAALAGALSTQAAHPQADLSSWSRQTSLPFQRHLSRVLAGSSDVLPMPQVPVRRLAQRRDFQRIEVDVVNLPTLDDVEASCVSTRAGHHAMDYADLADAQEAEEEDGEPVCILRQLGDWLEVRNKDGVYYFNEVTLASQWEEKGTPFYEGCDTLPPNSHRTPRTPGPADCWGDAAHLAGGWKTGGSKRRRSALSSCSSEAKDDLLNASTVVIPDIEHYLEGMFMSRVASTSSGTCTSSCTDAEMSGTLNGLRKGGKKKKKKDPVKERLRKKDQKRRKRIMSASEEALLGVD